MRSIKPILVLAGLSLSALVRAQEADSLYSLSLGDLLNVSVTVATKSKMGLDLAPGTVRVITRQQIEDMNARSLKDVLNIFVPGMDVIPTTYKYGDRAETAYARGVLSDFSQQVLYLINGKTKFNESNFGQPFQQGDVTLENIERIEVSSTPIPLQGASAITIINLITREGSMNGFEAHVTTGFSDNVGEDGIQRKRVSLIGGQEIGDWHVGVSAQFFDDLGQAHNNAAGTAGYTGALKTLRDGTKFSGVLGLNVKSLNEKIEWNTYLKKSSHDAFLSGLVPSQSGGLNTYDVQTLQNSLKINPVEGLEFSAGLMTSYFVNFIDFGGPYGLDTKNYDVFVEGNYARKIRNHSLLVGFKIEREGQRDANAYVWDGVSKFDVTKDPSLILAPTASRNIFSAFAEDQIQIGEKLTMNAGVRFDYFENFANTQLSRFNPRLGLTYSASESLIVKFLYVTAFRPPTNYELQGVSLVPLAGNRNIDFEYLNTLEANFIFKKNNFKMQLTPYLQQYNDRILYVDPDPSDADVILQANNVGNTRTTGVEFTTNYYFNPSNYFFVGLSSYDSKDEESGVATTKTPFLPSTFVNGGVNVRKDKFGFNTMLYYRGPRELPAGMPINSQYASGAVFNANVNLSFFPTEQSKVYLLVENVTDRKNYVPHAADGTFSPLRGRTYNVGAVITF